MIHNVSDKSPIIQSDIRADKVRQKEGGKIQHQQAPALDKTTKGEKVELSQTGKEIQKIKKLAEEAPEIRGEKVAELKQKIEQGTYNIRGEKVGQKLLEDLLIDLIS
jgi:negative regulator of flagellin synthesis FlgM